MPKSFLNVQAGLGIIDSSDFLAYSFSGALTYSYLLNPYRRTQCNPVPGHNSFEAYIEGGFASCFCDTKIIDGVPYVLKKGRYHCLRHLDWRV